VKSAGEDRAAVVHQFRLRKVAKMRKIAKSATASVEARALDDIRAVCESEEAQILPVAVHNT